MSNPYETPQAHSFATTVTPHRLDRGVLFIGVVLLIAGLSSIIGFVSPAVRNFVMPRFGWIGLLISINSLMFIYMWARNPSRRALLAASYMTGAIGVINACALAWSGTVDVVQNVFHDRLHSAWLWSVISYLTASGYIAFAVSRSQHASVDQNAASPPATKNLTSQE